MTRSRPRMFWVMLAKLVLLLGVAAPAAGAPPKPDVVTLQGTVVELSAALQGLGLRADRDTVARQVVLKGTDGTITPLLCDDASRALFVDARLRNRRAEIDARKFPGLPYIQVLTFRVEDQGVFRTPEYFCDVCTISVR